MNLSLLSEAAACAYAYLDGLDTRAVAPDPAALEALAALNEPLPDGPSDPGFLVAAPKLIRPRCGARLLPAPDLAEAPQSAHSQEVTR